MRSTDFPSPESGGLIIQTVNQLRGACVIQGPLLAKYVHEEEQWKDLPITESHPKALKHLPYKTKQPEAVMKMVGNAIKGLSSHELDATWCAVAAWAMIHHKGHKLPSWHDLYQCEQKGSPVQPFCTPVIYWMPIPEGLWTAG